MTADEYVPSEQEVRDLYADHCDSAAMRDGDYGFEFDRFPARVRRDAAREALHALRTHLAAQEPTDAEVEAAGEGIWNRYGDRGMWNHAPEHLRATFRADARAALTAARAVGRDAR